MTTYEVDLTIRHIQSHWRVDCYRYERSRHPANPQTWCKPVMTHVLTFNMPIVPTDQCWEDLTVRAALAIILRDMSGDHPVPAAKALPGGPPDTTQTHRSTISQAPPPESTARAKRVPLKIVRREAGILQEPKDGE